MLTLDLHVRVYPHTYAHIVTYIKHGRKGHNKSRFERKRICQLKNNLEKKILVWGSYPVR